MTALRTIAIVGAPTAETLNTVSRLNRWDLGRRRRAWKDAAYWSALAATPRPGDRLFTAPVAVQVSFPVVNRRRRDPHNWAITVKWIIDGIVQAGVLADDDTTHLYLRDSTFHLGDPRTIVTFYATDHNPHPHQTAGAHPTAHP